MRGRLNRIGPTPGITKVAAACATAGLLWLPALLSGCGGTSLDEVTIPSKAELTDCIFATGGENWTQVPSLPKDFPSVGVEVFMVGPSRAHLSYYISKRPLFSQKTVEGFAHIQEYDAYVRFNGRALVLLDHHIATKEKELAFSCLEG